MTSNFPGTVDIHGSETDKHAELRAEDERPARTVKPEESAGQAIASHIQPPQGKTQRRCALSRQEDGHFPRSWEHRPFPPTQEELWHAVQTCIF